MAEDKTGYLLISKQKRFVEIEMYNEKQIAEWEQADRMNAQEKNTLLKKVKNAE